MGALTATVLIAIAQPLFHLYTTHFAHLSVLSGALSGIVALLVWTNLSSCAYVFGICLCATKADGRRVDEAPARMTESS